MTQFPNLRRTDTAQESVVVPATAPAPRKPKGHLDNDAFIALGLRCAKERTSKQTYIEDLFLRALGLK